METFLYIFYIGLFIAFLFCIFMLIRNQRVYAIRTYLLSEEDLWRKGYYSTLPDYESMLQNPKYWGLWTVKQWKRWAEERNTFLVV